LAALDNNFDRIAAGGKPTGRLIFMRFSAMKTRIVSTAEAGLLSALSAKFLVFSKKFC